MKQTKYKYILFYKPYGVLCQFTDEKNEGEKRSTLADYIPIGDVYSVGRLDLDSEGLLLLTNNSILKHKLSDPKFAHPKTYWVQVEGIPDEKSLDKLRQGVLIKDYRTKPAKVRLLPEQPSLPQRNPPIRYRQNIPTSWLEITLTEGRNRQVRRMTASVGYPTLRLVRVSLGISAKDKLSLQTLKLGEWRYLSLEEISIIARLVRII
jgi:23S rRNA pseudouridine2457 synthase